MLFTRFQERQKSKTQNPRNNGHFSMSETQFGEREIAKQS